MRKNTTTLIILTIFLLVFSTLLVYFFALYDWGKGIDSTETREQLTDNFLTHEKEFLDLTSYFSDLTKGIQQRVSFSVEENQKISLFISPIIYNSSNKAIGAENVRIESTELDSALKILHWDKNVLYELRKKLTSTNCDVIRTTEIKSHPLEMYCWKSDWFSFSFLVFPEELTSEQKKLYGKPMSETEFGHRVILSSTHAL